MSYDTRPSTSQSEHEEAPAHETKTPASTPLDRINLRGLTNDQAEFPEPSPSEF